MKKGLMLIVLVAGLCGITKAQAQVEEVIIEQRLPGYKTSFEPTHSGITGLFLQILERMLSLPNIPHRQNLKTRLLLCLSWL